MITAPHLVLSVIDQASGLVVGQVQVDAKGSEIAGFTACSTSSTFARS